MQRMKADTASRRIVHRIRKKVINVDQHRRAHYKPGVKKSLAVKGKRDDARHQEV
jgi:hypothetical protein